MRTRDQTVGPGGRRPLRPGARAPGSLAIGGLLVFGDRNENGIFVLLVGGYILFSATSELRAVGLDGRCSAASRLAEVMDADPPVLPGVDDGARPRRHRPPPPAPHRLPDPRRQRPHQRRAHRRGGAGQRPAHLAHACASSTSPSPSTACRRRRTDDSVLVTAAAHPQLGVGPGARAAPRRPGGRHRRQRRRRAGPPGPAHPPGRTPPSRRRPPRPGRYAPRPCPNPSPTGWTTASPSSPSTTARPTPSATTARRPARRARPRRGRGARPS